MEYSDGVPGRNIACGDRHARRDGQGGNEHVGEASNCLTSLDRGCAAPLLARLGGRRLSAPGNFEPSIE